MTMTKKHRSVADDDEVMILTNKQKSADDDEQVRK